MTGAGWRARAGHGMVRRQHPKGSDVTMIRKHVQARLVANILAAPAAVAARATLLLQ